MADIIDFKNIPEPTIKRLAYYLIHLQSLAKTGKEYVSSTMIADELKFDPTQVRKDLQYTGAVGQPKIGFEISSTIEHIKECLHWNNSEPAFLIGAGNLGKAIMQYEGIVDLGIKFVAAFDNDTNKIGQIINGVEVLHPDRLILLSKLMKVNLGVLAVPESVAQQAADLLIEGGVTAIWNLLPYRIKVPDNIIVEDVHIIQSLAVLTNRLSDLKKRL